MAIKIMVKIKMNPNNTMNNKAVAVDNNDQQENVKRVKLDTQTLKPINEAHSELSLELIPDFEINFSTEREETFSGITNLTLLGNEINHERQPEPSNEAYLEPQIELTPEFEIDFSTVHNETFSGITNLTLLGEEMNYERQ